ncbi:MAG TPA: threonyl-tRNA synthetase editing domain-containing protein, partial [Methanomassiliicoccales archaeon]|nr:threonyl-tRNA synthetase editing domain-containing protein [Methanomassiliicoccales archaeon]
MRTLYIHADFMEFEVKKPTPLAEAITDQEKTGRMDEVLVAFLTVEKKDQDRFEAVASQASADIMETAKKVGAERIMLYPYAHLSAELSDAETGKKVLREMERLVSEAGWPVHRAPFGWYKAFKISCKGHPLSELSREIEGEETAPA